MATEAAPRLVYVVKGYDEEHGWVAAICSDRRKAEELTASVQAEADSTLEFYRVQEVEVQ